MSEAVVQEWQEPPIDVGALLERGELLVLQRKQVRPNGEALEDLKALQARATFLYEPLPKEHLDLFVKLVGEAVFAAFAVGFRVGLRGSLQVGAPML